jgi:hypothetical protein
MPIFFKDPDGKKFEDFATSDCEFVLYEIHRADILKKNKMPFLEFWDVGRIAKAERLHDMYGKIAFTIGGYDDDERSIVEIPETRNFLRELADDWPYFFYADNLKGDFLGILIECMVPNLTVGYTDADPKNYAGKMSTKAANEAYRKLLSGLAYICPMDKQMNQIEFDARVEAIQACLQKRFRPLK